MMAEGWVMAVGEEDGAPPSGGDPLERARGVAAALAAMGQPVTVMRVRELARVRMTVAAQAAREGRDAHAQPMLPEVATVLPPLGPNVAGESRADECEIILLRGGAAWMATMLRVLLGREP